MILDILIQIEEAFQPVLEDFSNYIDRYFAIKKKRPTFKEVLSLINIYSKCFKLKIP